MADWISVKEAADYTGYTTRHIRHLLIHGLVVGRKFGRDWFKPPGATLGEPGTLEQAVEP